jgi:arylsulfate sulfotransferase
MADTRRTIGCVGCGSKTFGFRRGAFIALAIVTVTVSACGGSGSSATPSGVADSSNQPLSAFTHSEADVSAADVVSSTPGASPFIERLAVHVNNLSAVTSTEFIIQPKPGAQSAAIDVSYSEAALRARNYLELTTGTINVPVFGLYAGYTNQVTLQLRFQDGSVRTLTTGITTAAYSDPTGIYQQPTFIKARAAGSSLGFSFICIKSSVGSPVIIDTDGEIRWVVPDSPVATSSALQDDEFVIGDPSRPFIYRLRLDGTITSNPLPATTITNFHHNIDSTELGLLADVTTLIDGVENVETTVSQISPTGSVIKQWDMAAILSAYMQSQGDNASEFVRPGVDWFHNNSATYDPSDGNVIISSRENFVVKVDNQTGQIIWILGDPTKYWYTFPSLRAKALTLASGGLYPIGQHALSMTSDGHLMLFNDGLGSMNEPTGEPTGESRTYSAVSAYSIDTATMTARNVWNFNYGQSIYAPVCSSAYRAPAGSALIDYATADNLTQVRLVGLDSNHNVAFDFEYPTDGCDTAWNSVPIALESLAID